jgi:hypothetical protein
VVSVFVGLGISVAVAAAVAGGSHAAAGRQELSLDDLMIDPLRS